MFVLDCPIDMFLAYQAQPPLLSISSNLAQTAAADQDGGQAVAVAEQRAFQNGEQVFHRVADALPK